MAVAALARGFVLATQQWRSLVPLLAANLAIALLASLPLLVALAGPLGSRPWLGEVTSPRWPELVLGLVGWLAASDTLGGSSPATAPLARAMLLGLLAVPLQALAYALLVGGLLERYMGRATTLRAAMRTWGWPFVRLWLLSVPIVVLAALVPLVALPPLGISFATALVVVVPILLLVVNALFELARVHMVASGDQAAWSGLRRALALVFRYPLRVLTLWVLLALVGVLVLGATTLLTFGLESATVVPAFLLQQVGIVLAVWQKGSRLAAQLALVRTLSGTEIPN